MEDGGAWIQYLLNWNMWNRRAQMMGSRELRPRGRDACTSRWDYHGWTKLVVASQSQQWCRKCIGLHYATCWRTGRSSTSQVHSAVEIIVCIPVHLPLEETPAVGHHLLWPLVVAASRCRSPWWIHHGERTMNLCWPLTTTTADLSSCLPLCLYEENGAQGCKPTRERVVMDVRDGLGLEMSM